MAQAGSALASGARGPEFKSRRPDHAPTKDAVFGSLHRGFFPRGSGEYGTSCSGSAKGRPLAQQLTATMPGSGRRPLAIASRLGLLMGCPRRVRTPVAASKRLPDSVLGESLPPLGARSVS